MRANPFKHLSENKLVQQSLNWMAQGIVGQTEFFERWRKLVASNKENCRRYRKTYNSKPESKERHRISMSHYRKLNPEPSRESVRRSYAKHAVKRLRYARDYRQQLKLDPAKYSEHKAKVALRKRLREQNDLNYLLRRRLRGRVRQAMLSNYKAGDSVRLLGCTIPEFKVHIESLWKSGMSWENYGRGGWHLDHKIPCNSFDLSNPEEQLKCFHYTNVQPLWEHENLSKGDRLYPIGTGAVYQRCR